MNTDQKSEKGNVARIVDRLSKDFGGPIGVNTGSGVKSENVPMRNRVVGVGPSPTIGGNIGWVDPTIQSAITKDTAAIVRFSYAAQQPDELDLKEGDELLVLDMIEDGWAKGEILNSPSHPGRKGRVGLYPTNFVSTVSPTPITQTPPINSVPSSGSTSTFPRAIDTSQNQENISGIPLSTSAPKSTPNVNHYNNNGAEDNNLPISDSATVLHTSNVLPSSLKGIGGNNTIGHSALGREGSGRRAIVSTLINTSGDGATGEEKIMSNSQSHNHQQQLSINQQNNPGRRTPPANQTKPKEYAKVLYKYEAANSDELSLPEGATVAVVSQQCEDEGWFVAEIDGRRGLFPDNFVKFIPAESTPPFHTTSPSSQAPPPILPAKPQKFLSMNPPPVASTRDSLSALNNSSANSPDMPTPPENLPNLMSMSMTTGTAAADMENNNGGIGGASSNFANKLSTGSGLNAAGNRKSLNIKALQKVVFPNGQIPLQPPKRPPNQASNSSGITDKMEPIPIMILNEEPKMKDLNSTPMGGCGAQKLLDKSVVKSRTKIAPTNKRPPSKVNSAAILADTSNNNDNSFVHPKPPPSPLASPITSGTTEQNIGGGSVSIGIPLPSAASSSQWVSRAEFDRVVNEYQRKFAEMQEELRELRNRMDLALNK